MARLQQDSENFIKYHGWYGTCEDCVPFKLADHISLIQSVTQYYVQPVTDEGRTGKSLVAETNTSNPSFFWDFDELKCGAIYEITLRKGSDILEIPNFIVSEFNKGDQGRIVTECKTDIVPTKLEFRCQVIGNQKVLQVKNSLQPLHNNFSNLDTKSSWATMYTYNPTHAQMDESAHTLSDAFWADVAVPLDYIENLDVHNKCCENEIKFDVEVASNSNLNGFTPDEDSYINANSFSYTGELCIGKSKGGTPQSILLYLGSNEYNTEFPIGKIDTLGGLDSDTLSFKVKENSSLPEFQDDLTGKCFTGTIVDGICKLYLATDLENTKYTTISDRTITIKKSNNIGYLQIYVDGEATFLFSGDLDATMASGDSENYPVVLCELQDLSTPTPEQPTPTPIIIPTPTPEQPTPTPEQPTPTPEQPTPTPEQPTPTPEQPTPTPEQPTPTPEQPTPTPEFPECCADGTSVYNTDGEYTGTQIKVTLPGDAMSTTVAEFKKWENGGKLCIDVSETLADHNTGFGVVEKYFILPGLPNGSEPTGTLAKQYDNGKNIFNYISPNGNCYRIDFSLGSQDPSNPTEMEFVDFDDDTTPTPEQPTPTPEQPTPTPEQPTPTPEQPTPTPEQPTPTPEQPTPTPEQPTPTPEQPTPTPEQPTPTPEQPTPTPEQPTPTPEQPTPTPEQPTPTPEQPTPTPEQPTPTPNNESSDCCDGLTRIPTNTAGVASVIFESIPGLTLCCSPHMEFTDQAPDLYEFGVKLDGGNIIGAIKIVARVGGISTDNFDSTKFVIEDSNKNFYEADLGGLTEGEINFVSKTCGSVTSVVDCCEDKIEIATNTAGYASILMESAPGYILCCTPKLDFTDQAPDLYEFGVRLDGGNIMGAIKIVARVGGISTTNFLDTTFSIKDESGNCFSADLNGMTGGEINFTSG